MKLRFFKQDGKWYADVPNHTLEENEMVSGADTALELISDGHNEITLDLTTDFKDNDPLLIFLLKTHDDYGATYSVGGTLYQQHFIELLKITNGVEPYMWICNVAHDVFDGEHPNAIYVYGIYFD